MSARYPALLGLVILCLLAAPARAEPPDAALMEAVPAERLLPFWRQYTARFAPGEARFEPAYRLDSEPASETGRSGLWLETAPGELHAIGLDARGYLVLPAVAAEAGAVHRQTRIWLDPALRPPVVRLEIHPRLPLARRYEISVLAEIAAEVERFQRQSMGLMFLASPRWSELVFRFDGAAPDGWLVRSGGQRVALTAFEDTLTLRLDGRAMRAGGHVELDAAPVLIVLEAR
ncbi:MAG: hypothetical protein JJU26_01190 [Oceanicaulis sp.]|uniref:hypothetical protein n=1 Tax=Glycocaulis sp. TaxID=1969725 RepID=UPI0025BF2AC4|nr:hypothetical protein [Glycocaulis sp.]MCC5980309.1 hypothetical protein [Oceanicaulis sp.]MCH8521556.1 hypothetical protein [Glycocaulis sp.]